MRERLRRDRILHSTHDRYTCELRRRRKREGGGKATKENQSHTRTHTHLFRRLLLRCDPREESVKRTGDCRRVRHCNCRKGEKGRRRKVRACVWCGVCMCVCVMWRRLLTRESAFPSSRSLLSLLYAHTHAYIHVHTRAHTHTRTHFFLFFDTHSFGLFFHCPFTPFHSSFLFSLVSF